MDGFARRIWGNANVDKTIPIKKGIFVIRFLNRESKEKALNMTNLMLDKRHVIMKNCEEDANLDDIAVVNVPTWIQLPNLPVKYWGAGCLAKIVELVGMPIKPDMATQQRERLAYARYLVEVPLNADLLDEISFVNEKGVLHTHEVIHEWRPIMYKKCKKMGHKEAGCMQQKKTWVPKRVIQNDGVNEAPMVEKVPQVTRADNPPTPTEHNEVIEGQKDIEWSQVQRSKSAQAGKTTTPQKSIEASNNFEVLPNLPEDMYVGEMMISKGNDQPLPALGNG